MKKANFVNKLCEVWHMGLTENNIISRFRTTGVYPVDAFKFPKDRLDCRLLKGYETWVELGRPEEMQEQLATAVNTPAKIAEEQQTQSVLPLSSNEPSTSEVDFAAAENVMPIRTSSTPRPVSSFQPVSNPTPDQSKDDCTCDNCSMLGPKPPPIPGKVIIPVWGIRDLDKSFQERILDKLKLLGSKNKEPAQK